MRKHLLAIAALQRWFWLFLRLLPIPKTTWTSSVKT